MKELMLVLLAVGVVAGAAALAWGAWHEAPFPPRRRATGRGRGRARGARRPATAAA